MVLLIDNHDSFSHMLLDYLRRACAPVEVHFYRNDTITLAEIEALSPAGIVLSPGPGRPADHPLLAAILRRLAARVPILGVCLGHQAIGMHFGARLDRAIYPIHGKTSDVFHHGKGLFDGMPSPFTAARYHSLILREMAGKAVLNQTAWTARGECMAIEHRHFPSMGVQFHPEAICTEGGLRLLQNWAARYLHLHYALQI